MDGWESQGGRRWVDDGDHQEKRQAATSSRSGSTTMSRVGAAALEVEVGQDAVEPVRQPPVGLADEAHRRGHEHHADERGVEEHGDREADAEHLAVDVVAEDEGTEDADHDERRGRDDPSGARRARRPPTCGCRRSRTYSSRTRDRRKTS